MATQIDGRPTFPVNAAIGRHLRVKLNSSRKLVVAAAADDDWIGTTTKATFAADDLVSITPRYHNGIVKIVCAEAAVIGNIAYGAADGEVQDASAGTGAKQIGIFVDTAAADQDIVGVMPAEGPDHA